MLWAAMEEGKRKVALLNRLEAAPRRVLALVSAVCVAMLAFGLYLQHSVGL